MLMYRRKFLVSFYAFPLKINISYPKKNSLLEHISNFSLKQITEQINRNKIIERMKIKTIWNNLAMIDDEIFKYLVN